MSFTDSYFKKHNFIVPHIQEPPPGLLRYIVVIPVYLEDKIEAALISIKSAKKQKDRVEVILVVNYSITDVEENKIRNIKLYHELETWCRMNSDENLHFHAIFASDLPKKHAGAGLARKIGMDEALYRFAQNNCSSGLILSLDADTLVDENYFVSIEEANRKHVEAGGFIYQFEHPTSGTEFSKEVYKAMELYELHLRYYKHALTYTGFPYAYYTIGSCFAVRAEYYAQQGGMNRRQAGEDFYFLNKLFPHKEFINIKNACVYPSPRESDRVPFGTGPAIKEIVKKQGKYLSYSADSFKSLKQLFNCIPLMYSSPGSEIVSILNSFPAALFDFLKMQEFTLKVDEIKQNTASVESFTKRFYQWFNAFTIVKYLNFSHSTHFQKLPVVDAVEDFLKLVSIEIEVKNSGEFLKYFRKLDKDVAV